LHSHHIQPQKDFIKDQRKEMNHVDNLVSLCNKCHDSVHDNEIDLRIISTPNGKEIIVS